MNDTTAQSADQTTSSCLCNPSQFASKRPKNSPKTPSTEISPGLLFTESRVCCSVSRTDPGSTPMSRGVLLFSPVGRCFPHPGAWELPVHNPSALICPTHVILPLLSHQSRQRERSVLGSGSAVTHSSCPGDGHTDPS